MKKILALLTGFMMMTASTVMALPYTGDLTELQNIFDGIGSKISATDDQSGAQVFAPTSGASSATYIATASWNTSGTPINFGLYDIADSSRQLTLFDTTQHTTGSKVGINFDFGNTLIQSYNIGSGYGLIDEEKLFTSFGFYFSSNYTNPTTGTNIYYSQNTLNPNNILAALTYAGQGDNVQLPGWTQSLNDVAHWYVAMEGYGGVTEFTDMVVQMESIAPPVPEPGTMMLLGMGMLGMAIYGKRRMNKQA